MIPSVGRIVHIRLSESCAHAINASRGDTTRSEIVKTNSGAIAHVGNTVSAGDIFPMMITRIWSDSPTESTPVNGQIFLDGNDTYWASSVAQGTEKGQWSDPRGE